MAEPIADADADDINKLLCDPIGVYRKLCDSLLLLLDVTNKFTLAGLAMSGLTYGGTTQTK